MQVHLMRLRQACQLQLAQLLERRKLSHQGLLEAMPAFIGLRHTSFQHLRVRTQHHDQDSKKKKMFRPLSRSNKRR